MSDLKPSPSYYRKGKKVDPFSTNATKPREVTTVDRIAVLEAVLDGQDHRTPVGWMNRWTVETIATMHGWPRQDLLQQNLTNLRSAA